MLPGLQNACWEPLQKKGHVRTMRTWLALVAPSQGPTSGPGTICSCLSEATAGMDSCSLQPCQLPLAHQKVTGPVEISTLPSCCFCVLRHPSGVQCGSKQAWASLCSWAEEFPCSSHLSGDGMTLPSCGCCILCLSDWKDDSKQVWAVWVYHWVGQYFHQAFLLDVSSSWGICFSQQAIPQLVQQPSGNCSKAQ